MKKIINLLTLISFGIIITLTVLLAFDIIQIYLWVKYLYLVCGIVVLVFLYAKLGKRTNFDECLYSLEKANKGLQNLNFNKKDRMIALEILRIKNYLTFATRYLDELLSEYDLYYLKEPNKEIEEIKDKLSSNSLENLKTELPSFVSKINILINIVSKENQTRKDIMIKLKNEKTEHLKNKK